MYRKKAPKNILKVVHTKKAVNCEKQKNQRLQELKKSWNREVQRKVN